MQKTSEKYSHKKKYQARKNVLRRNRLMQFNKIIGKIKEEKG